MLTMIEGDCPHCDASNTVRPDPKKWRRILYACFFRLPLRCRKCGVRFSVHHTPSILARIIDYFMP
jgi:hypothetical protein